MTQAIFIETAKAEDLAVKDKKRRLNVSGVLRILGVSRNGYYAFKSRKPSERQKHKEFIEDILNNRGRFNIPNGEYKERHHIIPKCLGGNNTKDNLIDLLNLCTEKEISILESVAKTLIENRDN